MDDSSDGRDDGLGKKSKLAPIPIHDCTSAPTPVVTWLDGCGRLDGVQQEQDQWMELFEMLQSAVAWFSFGATAVLAVSGRLLVGRGGTMPCVSGTGLSRLLVAVYRTQQVEGLWRVSRRSELFWMT